MKEAKIQWHSAFVSATGLDFGQDRASHIWVKGLSGNLGKEDFRKMLDERSRMEEKEDRELADSVLEVSISANKEMVDELIGDESMYETINFPE